MPLDSSEQYGKYRRPVELIAAASRAGTCIWSLKGKAHDLQVRPNVDHAVSFACAGNDQQSSAS